MLIWGRVISTKKKKKAERAHRTTANVKGINAEMDQAKNRVLSVNRFDLFLYMYAYLFLNFYCILYKLSSKKTAVNIELKVQKHKKKRNYHVYTADKAAFKHEYACISHTDVSSEY